MLAFLDRFLVDFGPAAPQSALQLGLLGWPPVQSSLASLARSSSDTRCASKKKPLKVISPDSSRESTLFLVRLCRGKPRYLRSCQPQGQKARLKSLDRDAFSGLKGYTPSRASLPGVRPVLQQRHGHGAVFDLTVWIWNCGMLARWAENSTVSGTVAFEKQAVGTVFDPGEQV